MPGCKLLGRFREAGAGCPPQYTQNACGNAGLLPADHPSSRGSVAQEETVTTRFTCSLFLLAATVLSFSVAPALRRPRPAGRSSAPAPTPSATACQAPPRPFTKLETGLPLTR